MKLFIKIGLTFLLLALNCSLLAVNSFAEPPRRLINYQGRLTDSQGVPLNGSYNVTFRIYDAEGGGSAIWTETHAGLTIQKGIFSTLIGGVTSLNLTFDKQYWLSIQVGSDPEMYPRLILASSGYAFRAENANNAINVLGVLPVANGGTGAVTAAAARTNLGVGNASIQAYSTPGTYTWTAPAGVTMVFLTMSGGGGGGGGAIYVSAGSYAGGGGGGSSEFMVNVPYAVTPGQTYTIVVGAGGSGGAGNNGGPGDAQAGGNGGNTSFGTLTCRGGKSGGGAGRGGLPGQAGQGSGGDSYGGPRTDNTAGGSIRGGRGNDGGTTNYSQSSGHGGNGCTSNYGGIGGGGGAGGAGQNGGNATLCGAGGGGGSGGEGKTGNGGNGSNGICIVMW